MKKLSIYLSAILVGAFFTSCGEAGVEVNVSKNTEIQISVTNLTAVDADFRKTVNLADEEFSEYLEDIKSYTINKIEFQINQVNGDKFSLESTPGNRMGVVVLIGELTTPLFLILDGSEAYDLIADGQNNLKTTDRIMVYNESNPSSVQVQLNQGEIDKIISLLENRSTMNVAFQFTGIYENANIDFTMFIDITAKVQAD